MSKRITPELTSISWDRVRAIFGDPSPPRTVWEKQFDYLDDDLQRISRTPYEQFDFGDLWYYHHDLAHVQLQPDLFAYLFPVCLMDWHDTLIKNIACSHGDSEFHYGLHHGKVLETMVTPKQQEAIYEFFRDSFMVRLDAERGAGEVKPDSFSYPEGWLFRLNSLALVMPRIDMLWHAWWSCLTPGRAISLLKYCSLLMYFEWENPLFKDYPAPPLWQSDSNINHAGWREENLRFLSDLLTVEYVHDRLVAAEQRLISEAEHSLARQLLHDWPKCRDLVSARIQELPTLLKQDGVRRQDEWTV